MRVASSHQTRWFGVDRVPFAVLPPVGAVSAQIPGGATQTAPATPSTAPDPTELTASGHVQHLSLDDAVKSALEQNLNIKVERVNPLIEDLSVAQVRTFWTPSVSTTFRANSQNSPATGFLSGGQDKVSDDQFSTTVGVSQLLTLGGTYELAWDSSRTTTTNIFSNFNPTLRSNISASFTQPLLRNFGIDSVRQQLLVTQRTRDISDIELRQTVVSTVRNVKNAYWDLVYALSSLKVQQQSLELARESLRNNQTRVRIGTMAPIDVVEAETEVARNEEGVIVAEAAIEQAEDRLRALVLDPSSPDFWDVRLDPTETPQLVPASLDIPAAVRAALDKRTDLRQARKNLEVDDVNLRYFRNQTLPDVSLQATYGLSGVGGTQLQSLSGFPISSGPREVIDQRSFGSVLGDIFRNNYPTWTVGITVGYPIGHRTAEANLARSKLQYSQSQLQIRNLEMQVTTQVPDLGRQLQTNLKRVEATRAARELTERRLEAEQKKFGVGMSTNFIVFQAQRDLAQARDAELKAILDSSKSRVDFEAIQEAAINGGGISVGATTLTSTAGLTPTTGSTTGNTQATSSSMQGPTTTTQPQR